MANDFTAPRHLTEPQTQINTVTIRKKRGTSPASSGASTPTIPSPASGQAGFVGPRQLRPSKSPLYMPAVLRPNEMGRRGSKPSELTPPSSIVNFPASDTPLQSPRSITRTNTNSSVATDSVSQFEMELQGMGRVTAMPSKEHWKSDNTSDMCDDATCTRFFTYFTRRHHCRRCGHIFCDEHSTHFVPLDQDANYHPRGTLSRACGHCSNEYKNWHFMRSSRCSSESSTDDQPTTPVTPNTPMLMSTPSFSAGVSCAVQVKGGSFSPQSSPGLVGSLGSSVPSDWHWSTF